MTNKKIAKQLMAIGVQRNDAAAFARTYNKIKDAKREDLFPGIVEPVMPPNVVYKHYPAQKLRATYEISNVEKRLLFMSQEDLLREVRCKLVHDIANALLESGAVQVESCERPHSGIAGCTQFRATVHVVMPMG